MGYNPARTQNQQKQLTHHPSQSANAYAQTHTY